MLEIKYIIISKFEVRTIKRFSQFKKYSCVLFLNESLM